MAGELDPLMELRFLTEALRAHAEWQQACGAAVLPAGVHAAVASPLPVSASSLCIEAKASTPPG